MPIYLLNDANWSVFANGSKTPNCCFVHRGAKEACAAEETVASAQVPPVIDCACRFVGERSKSPQSASRNEAAQSTSGVACRGHSMFRRAGLGSDISGGLSDTVVGRIVLEAALFEIVERVGSGAFQGCSFHQQSSPRAFPRPCFAASIAHPLTCLRS